MIGEHETMREIIIPAQCGVINMELSEEDEQMIYDEGKLENQGM
jgi:hypothetical protein